MESCSIDVPTGATADIMAAMKLHNTLFIRAGKILTTLDVLRVSFACSVGCCILADP
jgi:hypothetical protein